MNIRWTAVRATSDTDRAQRTPWNTYMGPGAAGHRDLFAWRRRAARRRASSTWRLAVLRHHRFPGHDAVHQDYQQHLANIELAKHNGNLDSAMSEGPKAGVWFADRAFLLPASCTWPPTGMLGLHDWT